jgi:hypothetical protein
MLPQTARPIQTLALAWVTLFPAGEKGAYYRMLHQVVTVSALLLALAATACSKGNALVDVQGACADAYHAQVCTWAKTNGATLVEAGAVVPLASLENAPADAPMVWPPVALVSLDMPDAVRQQGGLTQLTVFWEAGGHPPGAFMTPHFDFHFYTVPPAERAAMDCKDERKPAALPAAYGLPDILLPPEMVQMTGVPTLVGLCVPQMGMHAILTTEIERKDAFDGTMVIGYYKGKPIFIEPMLPKVMLMKKTSFDLPIPGVPGLAGPHPTTFHATYDAAGQAYRFIFSAFVAGI